MSETRITHASAGSSAPMSEPRTSYASVPLPPMSVTRIPYEQTAAFRRDCQEWKRQLMEGQTVLVTPGISKGELLIKRRCLESGYPLIHLQKEPIGRYWKPEQSRFEACTRGTLLILAPWEPEALGEVRGVPSEADYSVFHNLNALAERLCRFEGDATVVGGW